MSRARKVRCLETGAPFASVSEAARHYRVHRTSIYLAAKLGYKAAGLHWEYVDSPRLGPHRPGSCNRPVERSDGEVFSCITSAARASGISPMAIYQAMSRSRRFGKACKSGGFSWRFLYD